MRYINLLFNYIRYNRLNIVKTIWINFRYLKFKIAIRFPILIYGTCSIRCSSSGEIKFYCSPKRGIISIGKSDPVRSYNHSSYISIEGKLGLKGKVDIRRGIRMEIDSTAIITLGDNVFFSDDCTIISKKSITIGDGTVVGHNSQFIDTDFHYIINTQSRVIKKNTKPIIIGENNWIGAWCVIKKGTQTPKGTILAGPYSMIGKDYCKLIEPYTLIAGSPAKELVKNIRYVQNLNSEAELSKYFEKGETQFILPNDVDIDLFCTGK